MNRVKADNPLLGRERVRKALPLPGTGNAYALIAFKKIRKLQLSTNFKKGRVIFKQKKEKKKKKKKKKIEVVSHIDDADDDECLFPKKFLLNFLSKKFLAHHIKQ